MRKSCLILVLMSLLQLYSYAETIEYNGILYNLDKNKKTAEVIKWQDKSKIYSGDIVIPVSVSYNGDDYIVKGIAESSFMNCLQMKSIQLPESLESIGENAFYNCQSLTEMIIPDNVKTIGKYCFIACYRLKSVSLSDKLIEIEDQTFDGCESLKTIKFGSNLKTIKNYAFYDCMKLDSLNLPENLLTIGYDSFSNCSGLRCICFPSTITYIGNSFDKCFRLKKVYCYAETPPIAENLGLDYKNSTLYVPENRLHVYQVADGWKEFGKIEEIKSSPGGNDINSITKNQDIQEIYSLDGMSKKKSSKGINIIKLSNGEIRKILVR